MQSALQRFMSVMNSGWNISLFHYRQSGNRSSTILLGLQARLPCPEGGHRFRIAACFAIRGVNGQVQGFLHLPDDLTASTAAPCRTISLLAGFTAVTGPATRAAWHHMTFVSVHIIGVLAYTLPANRSVHELGHRTASGRLDSSVPVGCANHVHSRGCRRRTRSWRNSARRWRRWGRSTASAPCPTTRRRCLPNSFSSIQ